jgi:2-C-methyl-D-erythritol 4-phosphate cytidylyltransferase
MGQVDSGGITGTVSALLVSAAPALLLRDSKLLWRTVAERPLIAWALNPLSCLEGLSDCVVIAPHSARRRAQALRWAPKRRARVYPVAPGEDVWAVMREALPPSEWIIALDAAAPLVTTASLRVGLRAALRTGAAIAGEPLKETLKRVEDLRVVETLPRDRLRHAQAPIIARGDLWRRALTSYDPAHPEDYDLVTLAQLFGVPLTVYEIDYPGVRITSQADLALVETLLRERTLEAH